MNRHDGGQCYPDEEYRFFVFDPLGDGLVYYCSKEDRDEAAKELIDLHLDEEWDEAVEEIVAGEVTHVSRQIHRIERPPENEIDEADCDRDGNRWLDCISYLCSYELWPLTNQIVLEKRNELDGVQKQ